MDIEPPFEKTYPNLFHNSTIQPKDKNLFTIDEYCDLPLIDLGRLNFENFDKYGSLDFRICTNGYVMKDMVEASKKWGFFQVVNHGIPNKVFASLPYEQTKIFHNPFSKKSEENYMNFSAGCYRWGNPKATCLKQFSWSEAFHLPFTDISRLDECSNSRCWSSLDERRPPSNSSRRDESNNGGFRFSNRGLDCCRSGSETSSQWRFCRQISGNLCESNRGLVSSSRGLHHRRSGNNTSDWPDVSLPNRQRPRQSFEEKKSFSDSSRRDRPIYDGLLSSKRARLDEASPMVAYAIPIEAFIAVRSATIQAFVGRNETIIELILSRGVQRWTLFF